MSVIELYKSGMSIPEVSAETGVARSTIRFRLLKAGALRSTADGIRLARDKGKLGGGLRGKQRIFTSEWKNNISKGKKGKGKGSSLKQGYVVFTMGENKGRSEHVVLMEGKIKRKLFSNECVHHINGVRDDNRMENLELMTRSEHARHHATENNETRERDSKGQYK